MSKSIFKTMQFSLLTVASFILMVTSFQASATLLNEDATIHAIYQTEDGEKKPEGEKKKEGEEEPDC